MNEKFFSSGDVIRIIIDNNTIKKYNELDDIEISKMYKVHKDTIRDIRIERTWN